VLSFQGSAADGIMERKESGRKDGWIYCAWTRKREVVLGTYVVVCIQQLTLLDTYAICRPWYMSASVESKLSMRRFFIFVIGFIY
jgi:hypothetical protein